jgi:DGQHR domain-containing protein
MALTKTTKTASPKKSISKVSVLEFPAVRARVLGVDVYRGFGKLADLAEISMADIYDQVENPRGTQRDLSPQHAREAYEYVKNRELGFWPEVFLCARKAEVITFTPISMEQPDLGILSVNLGLISKSSAICISRIDGNHRLHYGDGKQAGYVRVEKTVSFCLAFGLKRVEEIQLFRDINDNQKRMNTSHLDGITAKLTPEEELKRREPELFIAQQLSRDPRSPLHGKVFEGGKRRAGADIPLRGLKTGVEYMLSRSTQLPHLEDPEAQFKVIRNYLEAVKKWQPNAWTNPKDYIVLRGAGLWAIFFIGAQVIDRVLLKKEYSPAEMLAILKSGKDWDWGTKGDFKGFSGRSGALEISRLVARKLHAGDKISTKQLFDQIMSEK